LSSTVTKQLAIRQLLSQQLYYNVRYRYGKAGCRNDAACW